MSIIMAGIDHTRAPLDVRQIFSFTQAAAGESVQCIKKRKDVLGCVIISTCNRMELWLSCGEDDAENAYEILCEIKQVEKRQYRPFFICREGAAAVEHLFLMAGGMKSQIVGEDQILSQVKEAVALSREYYGTDKVLQVLFRMAITAGKKVKTEVSIAKANYSAAHQALAVFEQWGIKLKDKNCLVIGNGEMGRITALALLEAGAHVTVTVRQYRSGMMQIPQGCERINYGERYRYIPQCDLIFSATRSPNYTITEPEVAACKRAKEQIYVDLAVPRDIEPQIAALSGVRLYDIDSFQIEAASDEMRKQLEQAKELIQEQKKEFFSWYECRDLIPKIDTIRDLAAEDLLWRAGGGIKELALPEEQRCGLEDNIRAATKKVVGKLMFELRDSLGADVLRECLDIWAGIYQE